MPNKKRVTNMYGIPLVNSRGIPFSMENYLPNEQMIMGAAPLQLPVRGITILRPQKGAAIP
jgi:hypothetical protein